MSKPFNSYEAAVSWMRDNGIGNHVDLRVIEDGGWVQAYVMTDDGHRVEFQHAPDWGDWVFENLDDLVAEELS